MLITDQKTKGKILQSVLASLWMKRDSGNIPVCFNVSSAMHFETSDEAFDFAVTKLKEVLTGLGFKEGEDKVWTR